MTDKQRILAEMDLLKQQLLFIETAERMSNSIQKEPVSIDFEKELYKAFGQVKDFTLCMRIAKWFYDMGYHQAEKDLELGWEDIKLLIDIVDSESLEPHLFDEIDYQEVLKRFREMKEVKGKG